MKTFTAMEAFIDMGIMNSRWITFADHVGQAAVYFRKTANLKGRVRQATLWVSSRGVYEISLNEKRVGNFHLAPGWTSYNNRIQYQQYDVTQLLYEKEVRILASVGTGWYCGRISTEAYQLPAPALIASLEIVYADGTVENIRTDGTWEASAGQIQFNDLYDGETYDERCVPADWKPAKSHAGYTNMLIPQEGEIICEQERFRLLNILHTPKGETVLDFGQNAAGYVEIRGCGKSGEEIDLSFGEIFDAEGNFYNGNYGANKARIRYICDGKPFVYHPHFTYCGFRYVRVNKWPEGMPFEGNIESVAVHSDIKRTGWFSCSDPMINTLYQNIIWGQRSNFMDVPTDCPQRDERMGWTGDAQIFCKTASYNFNVERFFRKWLRDVKAEQRSVGYIPKTVPKVWEPEFQGCAGWGDAVVICPWQIYRTYGDVRVLEEHYESMRKWVEFIRSQGTREELWDTGNQLGDWLSYDADNDPERISVKGKTNVYLVATAYYYYSASLVCRAGDIIGKDTSEYKALLEKIRKAFFETYLDEKGLLSTDTQTAYALTIGVGLAEGELKQKLADRLAKKIRDNGNMLDTGYLGTPWLLPVLAENGYLDLAVAVLFQTECPSWLYFQKKDATTLWERWNAIRPDGASWEATPSHNHYAYGAVADFLYENLCGIRPLEAGFKTIRFAPQPHKRFDWAEASIHTRYGMVRSAWKKRDSEWQYQFEIPAGCEAEICLGNNITKCGPGVYEFYSHIED